VAPAERASAMPPRGLTPTPRKMPARAQALFLRAACRPSCAMLQSALPMSRAALSKPIPELFYACARRLPVRAGSRCFMPCPSVGRYSGACTGEGRCVAGRWQKGTGVVWQNGMGEGRGRRGGVRLGRAGQAAWCVGLHQKVHPSHRTSCQSGIVILLRSCHVYALAVNITNRLGLRYVCALVYSPRVHAVLPPNAKWPAYCRRHDEFVRYQAGISPQRQRSGGAAVPPRRYTPSA